LNINDSDEEGSDVEEAADTNNNNNNNKTQQKKNTFKLSKSYGTSTGGEKWDHGNNRFLSKITVYTDGHVVKGIEVKYANSTQTAGDTSTGSLTNKNKATSFELQKGEVITSVLLRSNTYVQSLGFTTNKGRTLGPVGGKGWSKLVGKSKDDEGQEIKVAAPINFQLCGMMGRAGSWIDTIAFRWGPVPNANNKKK